MAIGFMETQSVPILPEHIWKNVSPNAATTSYGNKPPIIGSGPYETVAFVKGSYIEMVRNPYYWGKKPAVDTIYFETYQNADTMVADLRSGRIDGASDIPVAQYAQLKSATGIKAIAYPYYGLDYLEFNCYDKPSSLGNPVLRDQKFRQALNYAVDKQRIANLAYSGLATPGDDDPAAAHLGQPRLPLAAAGQRALHLQPRQGRPAAHRRRLPAQERRAPEQAGQAHRAAPGGARRPARSALEAKQIAGWLGQLGLKIKLSVIDSGTLESTCTTSTAAPGRPTSTWSSGVIGNYDPGQTMYYFTSSQFGNNDYYWSNPQYDKLAVEQAAPSTRKRQALIWRMQQIMYQQSPWIPLYPDNLEASTPPSGPAGRRCSAAPAPPGSRGQHRLLHEPSSQGGLVDCSSSSSTALIAVIVVVVIVVGEQRSSWFGVGRDASRTGREQTASRALPGVPGLRC